MNEIAFSLFCCCAICLTLTVVFATYAVKTLGKSRDFLDFAWDLVHGTAHIDEDESYADGVQDGYDKGYEAAMLAVFFNRNFGLREANTDKDADTNVGDIQRAGGTDTD